MLIRSSNRIQCLFYYLFLSLLLFSCQRDESDEESTEVIPVKETLPLKVMTYNIWGARPGGIPNLQEIADVIKRVKPDLVALQEVDAYTSRNGVNVHVARELAGLCGMEYFFAKAINNYGGEYGDAVLSRFPIKDSKAYSLSVVPELGGEQRSVARITVEVGGEEFYFISTHFDHLSNEANRIRQAEEFASLIRSFDKPVIVGADFNALPESETVRILRTQLVLGCRNNNCSQPTFSTSNPNRVIDYIMYTALEKLTVSNYEVPQWAYRESDHYPVVAAFEYKPD
ncbi:endonuclease/exonuclease/phosphatase family protein [Pontibacter harenae]|uniref:endonuclease/exonuclease/phosphatase family protein n=1 Tax=Pontibacter harenae TaxID=2894083 RepID=UPI001E456E92|nr:endonuclease/exonuclease/phosphatase family protein [Pontibacter harenae]MCC9167915.1 endonuclease/exonuclease/phosphatase family protein [Pontibacter harenae]